MEKISEVIVKNGIVKYYRCEKVVNSVEFLESLALKGWKFDKVFMKRDAEMDMQFGIGYYTLEELNRGKAIWQFYIKTIDENGLITAFSDEAMTGEQQQVTIPEDVEIYYTVGADVLTGVQTDVREYDRVMGVTDANGNLTHLYVIKRVYTGNGEMRYCEHCKQEVKWWSWENGTYLPTINGHFYLTGDVAPEGLYLINTGDTTVLLAAFEVSGTVSAYSVGCDATHNFENNVCTKCGEATVADTTDAPVDVQPETADAGWIVPAVAVAAAVLVMILVTLVIKRN